MSLSLEDKINAILSKVDKIDNISSMLEKLTNTVIEQDVKIVKLEATVASLSSDVINLKNLVNMREQDLRSCSIRVTGFPLTEEEKAAGDSKLLCKRLYDRVLSPILNAAKAKGHVDKLPALNSVVVDAYRLGVAAAKPGSTSPPPVLIKLTSQQIKVAIMRNKRESTPGPTDAEKAAGFRRVSIAEDLTPPSFKKLKELQMCQNIAKVWTVDGRIRLIMRGSSSIFKVTSVFEDVKSILQKASR